jgi:hypothetical protein
MTDEATKTNRQILEEIRDLLRGAVERMNTQAAEA